MNRHRIIACAALLFAMPAMAQELLRTFNLATTGTVSVSSELVVKANGSGTGSRWFWTMYCPVLRCHQKSES